VGSRLAIPDAITMGVDPDRAGAQPVGGTTTIAMGATQQVGFHLTATDVAYQGYQVKVRYDDAKLDSTSVPASWATNSTWPSPNGGTNTCAGPTITAPGDDDVGTAEFVVGCNDDINEDASYTGELGFWTFQCDNSGPGGAADQNCCF